MDVPPVAANPDLSTLGGRLCHARRYRRLSQVRLAMAVGMTQAGISQYEKNAHEPGANHVRALCDALRVSADWILGRTDRPLEEVLEP